MGTQVDSLFTPSKKAELASSLQMLTYRVKEELGDMAAAASARLGEFLTMLGVLAVLLASNIAGLFLGRARLQGAEEEESAELPVLVQRFCELAVTAREDPRRVDEVVCQFAYSGKLRLAGAEWSGHGALKRRLRPLLDPAQGQLAFGTPKAEAGRVGSFRVPATLAGEGSCEALLSFDAAALAEADAARGEPNADAVQRMALRSLEFVPVGGASQMAAEDGRKDGGTKGPSWETFDGRVRQQIWQSSGLFTDPTNKLLVQTLPLETGRLVLIVDSTVWDLYHADIESWAEREKVRLAPIIAEGNEDHKSVEQLLFLLDELRRVDPLRRSEPVLAVGGGVLTDLAGFACALWRRGIPWCRLPTTLMGMVDASVGIKVAANYHRKNGIGAFHSPLHTFVDATFLATVGPAEIRSGVGEMLKAALIHDRRLFDVLETFGPRLVRERFRPGLPGCQEAIRRSVDAMLACIGPDLWEESLVRPMDFGHSLSRTLEASEEFKLRHGEAVAIDCAMSTLIANVAGLIGDAEARRVLDLYASLGLPVSVQGISADTYTQAVREITVHRDGHLRAPLPAGIGRAAYVDEIPDADVHEAFRRLDAFIMANPKTRWDRARLDRWDRTLPGEE